MEIFVEQHVILPVRICLEFLRTSVNRPPPRLVAQEDPSQSMGNFASYFEEIHLTTRARRALDLEAVTVIQVERQQRADQQYVHRHPYWPTPVRVSPEHARVRFCREITYSVFLTVH